MTVAGLARRLGDHPGGRGKSGHREPGHPPGQGVVDHRDIDRPAAQATGEHRDGPASRRDRGRQPDQPATVDMPRQRRRRTRRAPPAAGRQNRHPRRCAPGRAGAHTHPRCGRDRQPGSTGSQYVASRYSSTAETAGPACMPTPVSPATSAASILKSHQLLAARLWRTLGDYAPHDRIPHGLAIMSHPGHNAERPPAAPTGARLPTRRAYAWPGSSSSERHGALFRSRVTRFPSASPVIC